MQQVWQMCMMLNQNATLSTMGPEGTPQELTADACKPISWCMLQRASFAVQDFLVRGLIGFDQSTGAMAVGEGVRVGQRLRFMVRDRDGAMRDLNDHGMALKRRQLQVHACCLSLCMV